ncbi:YvrJ family protein [Alteribacillus sp. JSM 102045]|uniref:YvrJ family protein n=1 Tax=Alteribacillus sp. JSM 102045 TaxID=1562101 RepID=UPI0035C15A83
MDIWFTAAGEYGVTAVIAFYLLHRMEKKMDILIYAVQQLPGEHAGSAISSQQQTNAENKIKQAK